VHQALDGGRRELDESRRVHLDIDGLPLRALRVAAVRSPSPPSLAPRAVVVATVDRRTTGGRPPPLVHQAIMTVVALASRAMLTDVVCRSPMSHLWPPLASHVDARASGHRRQRPLDAARASCNRNRHQKSKP
jgi:hypothetical protein